MTQVTDLQIAPRYLVKKEHEKVKILNIEIDNVDFETFLMNLEEGVVFTPNVDHLIRLQKDKEFYEVYQKAEYKVCDSRLIFLNSRLLLGKPIKEQIAGSDLFPAFCYYHKNDTSIKIFLLGGSPHSVQLAAKNICKKTYSNLVVGSYSPPFGFEHDPTESQKIILIIKNSGANVLAVGVGAPKQEKWIMKHKHLLPGIKLFFAIGATIEYEAGTLKRSPKWMTKCGCEWIYRLCREPKRLWKRYLLDDLPIFLLLLKQALGMYKNPWHTQ